MTTLSSQAPSKNADRQEHSRLMKECANNHQDSHVRIINDGWYDDG